MQNVNRLGHAHARSYIVTQHIHFIRESQIYYSSTNRRINFQKIRQRHHAYFRVVAWEMLLVG